MKKTGPIRKIFKKRLNIRTHLFFALCVFTPFSSVSANTAIATKTTTLANTPNQVAIASGAPQATDAGMAMFAKGGNAFDAAIAVASSLAVVEPYSSGIGGGGFFLLHTAKEGAQHKQPSLAGGQDVFIDAREVAPHAATEDMYLDKQGHVIEGASLNGARSAAIPGEVAGLVYLAENYGKLPLNASLMPAIKLARKGFAVDAYYQKMAKMRLSALQASPAAAHIFLRDNQVPALGTIIKQSNLANTLQRIAHRGNKGFYRGAVAKQLIQDVQKAGGIWTTADLLDYQVIVRQPVYGHYHNMTIIGAPLPSAGGIGLITALNILSHFDLAKVSALTRIQLVIESLRRIYLDRARYLGDPAFTKVPVGLLLSQDHADTLRSSITIGKATPSRRLDQHQTQTQQGNDTTHFSIMDAKGNWVSATLSVNYPFGSGFVAVGTGVLLNDHMDDFATKLGVPNVYGLVGSVANSIVPGKRPLSSMSPMFVVTPDKVGVLGTPGGSRIISMVLLAILDMADGKLPKHWVQLPRFHQQFLPDHVEYETGAWDVKTQKALEKMGYHLKAIDPYGNMQAILWDRKTNQLYAASDPRGSGKASVMTG